MNMIEIKRRTEAEMRAYKDGFRAGIRTAIDAIKSYSASMELLWLEEKEGEIRHESEGRNDE